MLLAATAAFYVLRTQKSEVGNCLAPQRKGDRAVLTARDWKTDARGFLDRGNSKK